jgi:thiol-disulfide isomerase/thioredoxin
MKKILVISVVSILAIGGGLAYLLGQSSTEPTSQATPTITTPKDGGEATPTPMPEKTGVYIDYKDGVIANTAGTKLLFFHAPWCPQCRALESDIQAKSVPQGVAIIKVDYDTSQALRQKYGVTLQTTVVKVDDEGKLVKKFVAYDDPSLEAVTQNLL